MDYVTDLVVRWVGFISIITIICCTMAGFWIMLPLIKNFFQISIYNIRLIRLNERYLIRKGYFFNHRYYCFNCTYSKRWYPTSKVILWEHFSTDNLRIANETYDRVRQEQIVKSNRSDKEVVIK